MKKIGIAILSMLPAYCFAQNTETKKASSLDINKVEVVIPDPDSGLDHNPDLPAGDRIFGIAGLEKQPEYPGGIDNLYKFINKKLKKPLYEGETVKAKAVVAFTIEKDGNITNVRVIRDPGYNIAKELERVIKLSRKWSPGINNGEVVRVGYTLPIIIELP